MYKILDAFHHGYRDVKYAVEYTSVNSEASSGRGMQNLEDIRIYMLFRVRRLDEITKGMSYS